MATTKRYYDENTGLYHVTSTETGYGLSSLDSKDVSISPQGNDGTQTTDYPDNIHVCKLIKADFRCAISGAKGVLQVGVIDAAVDTVNVDHVADYDVYDGFPIDSCAFFSGDSDWVYRKVWKPRKYAMSGDKEIHMTIDPQGVFTILWGYGMSINTVWKIL